LNFPSDARFSLAPKARVRIDPATDEPALLFPEGALLLNPTGAAIVELCDGKCTFAALVAKLAARYDAPANELEGDVSEYLQRLVDEGLVQRT
jgi:pyrroloquinoline quinone biosynthesis protein D